MVAGSRISREVANLLQPTGPPLHPSCYNKVVVRRTYGFENAHFRQARASHTRLHSALVFRRWRRVCPPAHRWFGDCLPHLSVSACASLGGCVFRSDSRSAASRLARRSSGKRLCARFFLAAPRVSRASRRLIISVDLRSFFARTTEWFARPPFIGRLLSTPDAHPNLIGTEAKCSRVFGVTDFC